LTQITFNLKVTGKLSKLKRTPVNGELQKVTMKSSFLKFSEREFVLENGERNDFSPNNVTANFTHLGVDVSDIEALVST
jgi:hypothetical protein